MTNEIEYNFNCTCSEYYYGSRCENEIDLCINTTCSMKGVCEVNSTKIPTCKCLLFYSGLDCEIKSEQLVIVTNIISMASVIAIISIISFYVIIVLVDVSNVFIEKHAGKNSKEKKSIRKNRMEKYSKKF